MIQPPGYNPQPHRSPPAILVRDTLYLSGSTGGDPKTGELERRIRAGDAPDHVQRPDGLGAAGMDLGDVVSVRAYLSEMADYARFNEIYRVLQFQPLPTPLHRCRQGAAERRADRVTMTEREGAMKSSSFC